MLQQTHNSGIEVLNPASCEDEATIIVVGLPRSGTTMVAKTLAALDIYCGAEVDDVYHEDLRIARALEDAPAELPDVIAAYNASHSRWAFKRPTAYKSIDPSLFRNPRFVIPFRDPLAVAKREEIAMGFDFRDLLKRSVDWTDDLVDFILRQTAPVMLVSYEKALQNPREFAKELAHFVGADADERTIGSAAMAIRPNPAEYVANSPVRKKPGIAVVIPYYNGSKYIERAVQSVLAQTVPASEFIIVDDGSSEPEAAFLDDLAKRYPFKVLHKANGGQGSARNAGVRATTADLICFLDQDDYYLGNHNEILLSAIPKNEPRFGWVYGDLYEADDEGNVITTEIVRHMARNPKTSLFDLLRHDMHVLPGASMISREAFEAVGGFDEQFTGYEDDDLFIRIFRKGYTNTFTDRSVTAWCMHGTSTSYSLRMSWSRLRFFKKMVAEYPDDYFKRRFYLRDCFIPRFHTSFVGDPAMAIMHGGRSKIELYKGRDELRKILREYADIVLGSDTVGRRYKLKLRAQVAIINTNSRLVLGTAIRLAALAVRVGRRLRL